MCSSFLADTPPKPASSTVFDPPQVNDADATEPHIRPKVYILDALPPAEEPSGIGTAHAEQTIAWPKHGNASRSHGTFLHASPQRRRALRPLKIHYMSRDHPKAHELTNHILHPSPHRPAFLNRRGGKRASGDVGWGGSVIMMTGDEWVSSRILV